MLYYCPKCKLDKESSEFYMKSDTKRNHTYCKLCQTQNVLDRQKEWKRKAIEYKGGKCCVCGYIKCDAALEFHHLDPKEKEFRLSAGRLRKFESSKAELDKCILVCANCHREIHGNLIQL